MPVFLRLLPPALLALACAHAGAQLTDIATTPLGTYTPASSNAAKPNIFMVIDDSGSMAWNYMPDNADSQISYQQSNTNYNGIAYNPALVYTPPVKVDSNGNVTSYPSMNGSSTANGATSGNYPNWGAVPNDGYGVQSTRTTSLTPNAYGAPVFYSSTPGEYCTTTSLVVCTPASAPSGNYIYPASVRWCTDSSAGNTVTTASCKASYDSSASPAYTYLRMASPVTATLTFSGSAFSVVSSITVDGQQILSGATQATPASVADAIDQCTYSTAGTNCDVVGFTATSTSSTVTITAPTATSSTPVVSVGNGVTISASAFAGLVPGYNTRNTITGNFGSTTLVNNHTTSYPGATPKAAARTDCAASVCTLQEEMTNYANWWAYYQTRILMLKSAASNAFAAIDTPADVASGQSRFRIGMMTINNNSGNDFVNPGVFTGTQKGTWYNRLTHITPGGSTPLMSALATAGQLYAGKLTGSTLAGTVVADPLQYSCQHNYALVSTDGFWNTGSSGHRGGGGSSPAAQGYGTKMDGVTLVGDQTSNEPPPYGDSGTSNTLSDVAAYYYQTNLRSANPTDGTGTCTGPVIAPATTPNNLCANNVAPYGLDTAAYPHMTTFTMGLGAEGKMVYAPTNGSFWNDTSGDFYSIYTQQTANPSSGICSWQSSGVCTWPVPASNSNANVDDLWHAAITGRGSYFSAKNPGSLTTGLSSVLTTISNSIATGTAAAASGSNPNYSTSNSNYVFTSSYQSGNWVGDLTRSTISSSGTIGAQSWSAQALLDCQLTAWSANTAYAIGAVYRYGTTCYQVTNAYSSSGTFDQNAQGTSPWDTANASTVYADAAAPQPVAAVVNPLAQPRTVYTLNPNGTQMPLPLVYGNLPASLQAYFSQSAITYSSSSGTGLSQFCSNGSNCLSSAAQSAAAGANLVNFLTGSRTYESQYYRVRSHLLGDIVSSAATYVQSAQANYNDAGYGSFAASIANRAGTVYVGANDGMLHAFDATSGQENWAYVPGLVLPRLYQLADSNYANQHQFFVDGTPATGDICVPANGEATCSGANGETWKTILVGGLNRGGAGYYALDITNPASPLVLWEYSNAAQLGYSYGNPKITKLPDGTWAVLVSSGYNNADGLGHLFALNAATGALIRTISTSAGSSSAPSGLARVTAYGLAPQSNNTTLAVYGGDLLGNVWRFDPSGVSGSSAQLITTLQDSSGNAQPITVMPNITLIDNHVVLFLGTGKFLGVSDIGTTQTQSFYAIADTVGTSPLVTPRYNTGFVAQTLSSGTCPATAPASVCAQGDAVITSTANSVDWSTNNGWYFDFINPGERDDTDPALALGTVLFTTNTPATSTTDPCGAVNSSSGGGAYIYSVNYLNGSAITNTAGVVADSLGHVTAATPALLELPNGTVVSLTRVSGSASAGASTVERNLPLNSSNALQRRVSWRDLSAQ